MASDQAPVLIAYDGSELSRAAVRRVRELFPDRPAVVTTVWEPGLAAMPLGPPDALGGPIPADPEMIETVDRVERQHATQVAQEGVKLARALGLAAELHVVPDEVDVADAIIDLARKREAAAVVVGSHGRSGLRSLLLGSVSHKVVSHCDRPVVVIRGDGS